MKIVILGLFMCLCLTSNLLAGGNETNYATYGEYVSAKSTLNKIINIYKPKKDGHFKKNAPVIIFSSGGWGGNSGGYEGIIKFIVSKGYVVIGVGTRPNRKAEFKNILNALNNLGDLADKSKVGLMGHSTGGGTVFYNLQQLQRKHYATNSFVISLDGWFPFGLTAKDLRNLHTTTLLLQFDGADGGNQDPRILQSIYKSLPDNEKAYSFLNHKKHGYIAGSMSGKNDLLTIIGAMLIYKFENGGQSARKIALEDKYNKVFVNKNKNYYWDCTYHYTDTNMTQDFDYSDTNNPKP